MSEIPRFEKELAKPEHLSSSRAEGYDGLGMSAEWVQNAFLNHFSVGYLRVESVKARGRWRTRWEDNIRRDAEYAGLEQDPEVVGADRTQWRDVLALLVF